MKILKNTIIFYLIILNPIWLYSQNYAASVSSGNFAPCPTATKFDSCPSSGTAYLPNTITIGVHADGFDGTSFRLVVAKCDATPFQNSTTVTIKEDGVCGEFRTSRTIPAGQLGVNNLYYIPSFTTGQKDIYAVLESGGSWYYAGPIRITALSPPETPTLTSATAINANEIEVKWSNVSDENGYNIYRANCASCEYSVLVDVNLPANTTTFHDTNASQGEDYCYKVTAFNNCLLYTSPSPRDATLSRMPSSA